MERRQVTIGAIVWWFMLLLSAGSVSANEVPALPDSLLPLLFDQANHHAKVVRHYESELYIKGNVKLHSRNRLIKFVPQMLEFEKGVNEYIGESYNSLNYTAPFTYDRQVIAVYGTYPKLKKEPSMILDYFTVNIYKETIVNDRLLSPFFKGNQKYYVYQLDSVAGTRRFYSFRPRYYNTQLLSGSFVLEMRRMYVAEVSFSGKYEFLKFDMKIQMGEKGYAVFLPSRYDMHFLFNFAGNKMEGHYVTAQQYSKIELAYEPVRRRKHRHDLTDRYALSVDTTRFMVDSVLIAAYRFFPLKPEEQHLYEEHAQHRDSLEHQVVKRDKGKGKVFWGKFGDALISNYNLNIPSLGKVKCSPIINPILFNYSKSSGYAYRQDFKYNLLTQDGRWFYFFPRIGYNFTFREFNWRVRSAFEYWPAKQARWDLSVGNGNRIYSSEVLDQIKDLKLDSLDFDRLHLDYFNDFNLTLEHRMELVNGLRVTAGVAYHRRTPVRKADIQIDDERIQEKYISFAPRVRIDYTPGQYYYWNGRRKIDIYSPYPTFSLDWERGIKGVFGSTGEYERWEFELNYMYRIDAMRRLSYQFGCGVFTNMENLYFVDFHNFSHNYLPEGWEDELGGVFQLLDRRWYNASRKYMRGHLIYDSPLLVLTRLWGVARVVQTERLYLNMLVMPNLKPYGELGYGFATHVFDLGFFVGLENWKYSGVGMKFTFELFNR